MCPFGGAIAFKIWTTPESNPTPAAIQRRRTRLRPAVMGEKRDTDMNTYKTRDITPPTLHQLAKSLRYMNKPIMADVADEAGEHLAALEAENAKLRAALEKTLDTLRIYSYTEYLDAHEAREALEAK